MAKQDKTSRQAVIDEIRNSQKAAERRRGGMIVGVAVVLGLLIIGAAAWKPITDSISAREFKEKELSTIGAKADVCQDVTTKPAEGMQDHVAQGTEIPYADAPPAFGTHYDSWEPMERKFYGPDDRPELGYLVHNQEHGYTLLWYNEKVADDAAQMKELRGTAARFDGDDMRNKFKVVPWTAEDGDPFPEGQNIALTHWSAGGTGESGTAKQVGAWQYCSEFSGEALEDFMTEYPYMDSPEPLGG
ncbi:DUF3105 domain-containing protein [Nocardioides daphniae]|uniref:DUF3105 domain-containing protein n=1 Tax=Nocardioides daphniae TaxID=402297 RepID=A0A4P7UCH0_9ACTN|nr:DUF3105 domain-containing protein [Nocardioides daphniae]QCC77850.1 DUF3105 domain-containing protein [Nocardioides daphniae]GGD27735.1 hypothetical protein GCM10007231_29010 [Nocardioides daphniae]